MDDNIEQKKDEHMEQAGKTLLELSRQAESIRSGQVSAKLDELIRALQDLRDTQYVFDSGEAELDRLYGRYLPYLLLVIGNYADIEETGHDPEDTERVRRKLIRAMDTVIDALNTIKNILPQDEISNARAEAEARKKKEELDQMFPRIPEIKDTGF